MERADPPLSAPTLRRELVLASSRWRTDRLVERGTAARPFRGVYAPPGTPSTTTGLALAALATQPKAARASHWTAVRLYGWETLHAAPDSLVHLTVPPARTTRQRSGLRLHESKDDPGCRLLGAVPVTAPARTVMDVAVLPSTSLVAAVALADAAVRAGSVTLDELAAMAGAWSGRRGAVRAREVARLSRSGARSCPETFARVTLELAGMTFTPAYTIRSGNGATLFEGDLADEEHLLWLEYDGYDVHSERAQFRKDRSRSRAISRRGWRVLAFTDEILANPAAFVAEVRWEWDAAPARIRGLPAGLSQEADAARTRWLRDC